MIGWELSYSVCCGTSLSCPRGCFKIAYELSNLTAFNTLRPRQDGRHFTDDIFKRIFLNENIWIPIKISLKFVPKGSINNIPALVQVMAWRRPGDKPLSEPMMINLLTHICVTRPQWVNISMLYTLMYPFKFHTKYLIHILKDVYFIRTWKFKSYKNLRARKRQNMSREEFRCHRYNQITLQAHGALMHFYTISKHYDTIARYIIIYDSI